VLTVENLVGYNIERAIDREDTVTDNYAIIFVASQ
jgi:hypothetical protein